MNPGEESEVLRCEREELKALRDAEDHGGTRRVGGIRYDTVDLPDMDDL